MSDTNNIVFDCPECRQGIKAPANLAGEMAPCPNCGKDVKVPGCKSKNETDKSTLSPQSNHIAITPVEPGQQINTNKKSSGMAVAGLVFGIIAIVPGLFCGGPIWAVLGIIFSSVALYRISKKPEQYEGYGLAVAGLITSIVGLMINLIALSMLGFMGNAITTAIETFSKLLK